MEKKGRKSMPNPTFLTIYFVYFSVLTLRGERKSLENSEGRENYQFGHFGEENRHSWGHQVPFDNESLMMVAFFFKHPWKKRSDLV